jgi:hypothetical protein
MVVRPNAVIDPRAVMVVSLDTPIANTTMPGSGGSHDFAFRAELQRIDNFH